MRALFLLWPFVHVALWGLAMWPFVRTRSRRLATPRELVIYGAPFVVASVAWVLVLALAGGPSPAQLIAVLVLAYVFLLGLHVVATQYFSSR